MISLSMLPILAAATEGDPGLSTSIVVIGLTALLNLALTAKQLLGGNKGERQIEPTQLAAISGELQRLTSAVNSLNREVGAISTTTVQVDGLHSRVGGISRELAATVARVDGLEKRENHRHA